MSTTPDGGLHRPGAAGAWHATAAAVVEILSPGDESLQKLPFYAAHDVDEVLLVDPAKRRSPGSHCMAASINLSRAAD